MKFCYRTTAFERRVLLCVLLLLLLLSPERWYLRPTPSSEGHSCFIHYWLSVIRPFMAGEMFPSSWKEQQTQINGFYSTSSLQRCNNIYQRRMRCVYLEAPRVFAHLAEPASPPLLLKPPHRFRAYISSIGGTAAAGLPAENPEGIEQKVRMLLDGILSAKNQIRLQILSSNCHTCSPVFTCEPSNKIPLFISSR